MSTSGYAVIQALPDLGMGGHNGAMSNIVVTGASRGIGLATALDLARAGAPSSCHDAPPGRFTGTGGAGGQAIRPPGLALVSDRTPASRSLGVHIHRLDTNGQGLSVNNAGIEKTAAIEETPLVDFRTCMETNYFGAIRCIQAIIRPMRERGSGAIINVTSVAGKISV